MNIINLYSLSVFCSCLIKAHPRHIIKCCYVRIKELYLLHVDGNTNLCALSKIAKYIHA